MASFRGVLAGRARWLVTFTLLLFASSAVPVLAESSPGEPAESEAPLVSEAEAEKLPDTSDVAKGLEEAHAEEAARKAWLESPEAEQQREESLTAYADASPAEAVDLLGSLFAEQLALIDQDPARALSDAKLEQILGPTGARIAVDGETVLMEGSLPVRAPDEDGDLQKVDLDLIATEEGYAPQNPLTEVGLPELSSGPMTLGEEGFAIEPVLTRPPSAALALEAEDLLYPETQLDTDLIAVPLGTGLELFSQLRSVQSPEELRFELTLPPGATLREDGEGGAEVVRESERLIRIPAPFAVDAQGADVPVQMRVEGNQLALEIEHRAMAVAYPLLVDPIAEDWAGASSWHSGQNLASLTDGTWLAQSSDWGRFGMQTHSPAPGLVGGAERGLFVLADPTSETQWAYKSAQWSYTVPGQTTYITDAGISPFWRFNFGCGTSSYPQPHDYVGLWSPTYGWIYHQADAAHTYGHAFAKPPEDWRKYTAQVLILGLGTGIYNTAAIPCSRFLYAGGAYVWMDDLEKPSIGAVSGLPPDEWLSAEKLSIKVPASDAGLGVRKVTVLNEGKNLAAQDNMGNCTGLRASPCPAGITAQLDPSGLSFGEGIRGASIQVEDPLGKVTGTGKFTIKVDRTSPEITLEGQLAKATDEVGKDEPPAEEDNPEPLPLPVYNLQINTTDGSTDSDINKRSGVKDIKVFLDKEEKDVPWESLPSCPETSCPMNVTYTLGLTGIETAGLHVLKVIAVDFAGNEHKREIEFEYFPATGMKDEYLMHYFPLPDGLGDEEEEMHPARPELAVNVMNGNLVYRERDFEISGAAVELELERYYNSQLPNSENTEWGDGWTLAQTPELEPEEGPTPSEAEIVDSSGALDGDLELPAKAGEEEFDPELQATIAKEPDGGYELTDETGESATSVAFNEDGRAEALRTEGHAKVDFQYEGSELAEIAVEDPATFAADPEELEIESGPIEKPTFAGSFGTKGAGDGQLVAPAGVARDFAGNLWVADKSNHRIQKFDPAGKFLFKFGVKGSANGQLSSPSALVIDAQGNIWVADSGNRRVQKFNSKGEYLAKFGSQGTGNGQFSSWGPRGIATDAQGNLWVSDYSSRVQKFNPAGEFLVAAGSFGESAGLDGGGGKVWVGDWTNNRVNVFSEAGEFLFNFGTAGTGDGQFSHPDAVEVDAAGNVWVGDQSNHRVQQFDSEGKYVAKFGGFGTGKGQFSFAYPLGIETDGKGSLWVADVNNHRVQEWLLPIEAPAYDGSFGASGSEAGQLKAPADVARGLGGSLWVADMSNHRIQKFSATGEFLFQFGKYGEGEGEFAYPASVAVDRDGNLLVADRENHRVQKFSPQAEFLDQFGAPGTEEGQFYKPETLSADFAGNVWVCDSYNGRIQRFDEEGNFVEALGSKGSGEGQFGRCTGIDVDPDGRVWAGDWVNNRVNVFGPDGKFHFSFGSSGSGPGQFNRPDAIEVDSKGNVWVGDQDNHRVQLFDSEAKYVRQLGSYGAGAGQFNFTFPLGIEADSSGHLWIADPNNHRVQRWLTANHKAAPAPPIELTDGDPAVEVHTEGGLVSSVEGNAAGEHSYKYEGDALLSHEGPDGETAYEYDEASRLTKVTLANGTWGEIAYDAYGRVKSVTVAPEGSNAKTTYFTYGDGDPRRTTVIPPDDPHLVYDIGEDGSVLKWWNKELPPELKLAGTLYDYKEEPGQVWNGDQTLESQAKSKEGIASIQVIANGSQLVSEETCEQTPEEGVECDGLIIDEWITNTDSHPPGHLNLEVIATDRIGNSSAERFWVDIPEPPPPLPPGSPVPPKFGDILEFREEFGLEVVFPVKNETELNERIFNLINAWYEGDPVARASAEKWGVPLRPADVAELEYREWYIEVNGPLIDNWGYRYSLNTYAGYMVDHRSGGIIRVGFTQNQQLRVDELLQQSNPLASDRLSTFFSVPTKSRQSLENLEAEVVTVAETDPLLAPTVVEVGISDADNSITVGTTDVLTTQQRLTQLLGTQTGIVVSHQSEPPETQAGRDRQAGRMLSGDRLWTDWIPEQVDAIFSWATAGFGAYENTFISEENRWVRTKYLLAAGHMGNVGSVMYRIENPTVSNALKRKNGRKIGVIDRNARSEGSQSVDALAMRFYSEGMEPRKIFGNNGNRPPIGPEGIAFRGQVLCVSGARTEKTRCGKVINVKYVKFPTDPGFHGVLVVKGLATRKGDSGAPVWNPRTGTSVGILSGGHEHGTISYVQPLSDTPKGRNTVIAGALSDPVMGDLHVMEG